MRNTPSEITEFNPSVEDVLSYALFPQVALEFFKRRRDGGKETTPAPQVSPQTPQPNLKVSLGGKSYDVAISSVPSGKAKAPLTVFVNGKKYDVDVEHLSPTLKRTLPVPAGIQKSAPAPTVNAVKGKEVVAAEVGTIQAPMPGKVVDTKVKVGDKVKKGDVIIVLEAMKMQNEIYCPYDGIVKEVRVQKGDSVESGAVMLKVGGQ